MLPKIAGRVRKASVRMQCRLGECLTVCRCLVDAGQSCQKRAAEDGGRAGSCKRRCQEVSSFLRHTLTSSTETQHCGFSCFSCLVQSQSSKFTVDVKTMRCPAHRRLLESGTVCRAAELAASLEGAVKGAKKEAGQQLRELQVSLNKDLSSANPMRSKIQGLQPSES